MIIGIAGKAGSGKDTVAGFICNSFNGISIAQADPMKRFAEAVFGFSQEQLWGPSECRNAPDARFDNTKEWEESFKKFELVGLQWLKGIGATEHNAIFTLEKWFAKLWHVYGPKETGDGTIAPEQTLTPRIVLQLLGTEFGRSVDPNVWSNHAIQTAKKLLLGVHRYEKHKGLVADSKYPGPELVVISDVRFRNEVLNIKNGFGMVISVVDPNNASDSGPGVKDHQSEKELNSIPSIWFDCIIQNNKWLGLEFLEEMVTSNLNWLIKPEFFG